MKTNFTARMATLILICCNVVLLSNCKKEDNNIPDDSTVKDRDGNVYHTIKIGSQIWMVENLKVTKLNDGTILPNEVDNSAWLSSSTPAYCWYNNDSVAATSSAVGALYNWYAVNSGKLCPAGWHIPDVDEWNALVAASGNEIAGGALKEAGTSHWSLPNTGATNSTGFNAIPGGFRHSVTGGFKDFNFLCSLWSSTENPNETSAAFTWNLSYKSEALTSYSSPKTAGASVRCVKDK
jgi:uncharacterized protein (TIGR02145 family)